MAGDAGVGSSYGLMAGFIFIFNLIVGAGSLALPYAFNEAGLVLGSLFLGLVAFLGYISTTFVVEALSISNMCLMGDDEQAPLKREAIIVNDSLLEENEVDVFEINQRVEMSQMTDRFFPKIGKILFAIVIMIYLYGDLAIYAVSVPNVLAQVTGNFSIGTWDIATNQDAYWFHLTCFALLITPLCFFDFQKTKWLQIATMTCRNVAFFMMIILAILFIAQGNAAPVSDLKFFNFGGLSQLFGVAVYAFMCHHSIPGIVSPLQTKRPVYKLFLGVFSAVLTAYLMLSLTAVVAFAANPNPTCPSHPGNACELQPLYTMNFASFDVQPIAYYLSLFPVLTLSSNFPLIAITLRNNMLSLVSLWKGHPRFDRLRKPIFAFLVVLPPFAIAYATRDVQLLVSFTGAYAGLCIMFLVPAFLVFLARRYVLLHHPHLIGKNPYSSPFQHRAWIYLIWVWAALCFVFTVVTQVYKAVTGHSL